MWELIPGNTSRGVGNGDREGSRLRERVWPRKSSLWVLELILLGTLGASTDSSFRVIPLQGRELGYVETPCMGQGALFWAGQGMGTSPSHGLPMGQTE